jgi:hypothetical protein
VGDGVGIDIAEEWANRSYAAHERARRGLWDR